MPLPGLMASLLHAANAAEAVNLPDACNAEDTVAAPGTATASITFKRDGTVVDQDATVLGTWVSPAYGTIGDGYDVKHTRTGGTAFSTPAAADDTWIQLNSDRTYENTATSTLKSTSGVFSVRRTGAGSAIDTATGSVTAESS